MSLLMSIILKANNPQINPLIIEENPNSIDIR